MNLSRLSTSLLFFLLTFFLTFPAHAQEDTWYMAGANPQRTSWVSEEVTGNLTPDWYRPIEPHIPYKSQIIASHGLLYVSTANGLYALQANDGSIAWVYPTEMPLGHSVTIVSNRVYMGGFDKRIHCIHAHPDPNSLPLDDHTGYRINDQVFWTFTSTGDGVGAGFDTNPLVVDGTVYMGNRDGYFYAVNADTGALKWRYRVGKPIHFSAAYHQGRIVFGANDSRVYILDTTGNLIWRSEVLPTWGFHSWWPTILDGVAILPANRGYRFGVQPTDHLLSQYNKFEVGMTYPMGEMLPGNLMLTTNAIAYLENPYYQHRRNFYFFDLNGNGTEMTFDANGNGIPEYAPLTNLGTGSGQHYPVVIGPGNIIYNVGTYMPTRNYEDGVYGWVMGEDRIRLTGREGFSHSGVNGQHDEPLGFSIGGNVIYWNLCCDRMGGGYHINTRNRWTYYSYNLRTLSPNYNQMATGTYEANAVQVYGTRNGTYGSHGDQNPPVPYQGRVYIHRGNAIIAWGTNQNPQTPLPLAQKVTVFRPAAVPDKDQLRSRLTQEVQKMLDTGHLLPGYRPGMDAYAAKARGDLWGDYFHNPAEVLHALSLAVKHLPSDMREPVRQYLANEYTNFPPHWITHIGWQNGTSRDDFIFPPEVANNFPSDGQWQRYTTWEFPGWTGDPKWNQMTFYYLWKYAAEFGNAGQIFDHIRGRMTSPPSDSVYFTHPMAHNAWIAGLMGYLELEKLAGQPESTNIRTQLDRLLTLRITNFDKDNSHHPDDHNWWSTWSVARNFIFFTPELADYLRQHSQVMAHIDEAMKEYQSVAPYWFVTNFEETFNEDIFRHNYDYHALFSANAFLYNKPYQELAPYLDVPAFERGDLFYIQNLVAALEAPDDPHYTPPPSQPPPTSPPLPGDINGDGRVDIFDYNLLLQDFGLIGDSPADINGDGRVDIFDYNLLLQYFGS